MLPSVVCMLLFSLADSFVFNNVSRRIHVQSFYITSALLDLNGFGYSVVFHMETPEKLWLLVGALDGNHLHKCKFPQRDVACEYVMLRQFPAIANMLKTYPKSRFGFSMSPSNPTLMGDTTVCAPFYDTPSGGRCFQLNEKVLLSSAIAPTLNDFHHSYRAYLQEGFSVATYMDDDRNYYHLFGSPSFNHSCGIVGYESNKDGQKSSNHGSYFEPYAYYKSKLYNEAQMIGFSVALTHRIFRDREIYGAFGGPGVTGADKFTPGVVMFMRLDPQEDLSEWTLIGEDFGSYFGTAIEFADVNGDDLDDMIVGAPHALVDWDKNDGKNRNDKRAGSVYIFYNRSQKSKIPFSYDSYRRIRCPSELSDDSFFGATIRRLGDINNDGLEDFAVGAPNDHQVGAVVIYLGSRGYDFNYSQILRPEDSKPLGRFGFSLASALPFQDFNNDQLVDLAIGDPFKNRVYVYFGHSATEMTVRALNPGAMPWRLEPFQCRSLLKTVNMLDDAGINCYELFLAIYVRRQKRFNCADQKLTFKIDVLLKLDPSKEWLAEGLEDASWIDGDPKDLLTKETIPSLYKTLRSHPIMMIGEKSFDEVKDSIPGFFFRNSTPALKPDIVPGGYLFKSFGANCVNRFESIPEGFNPPHRHRIILIDRYASLRDSSEGFILGVKWKQTPVDVPGMDLQLFPAFYPRNNTQLMRLYGETIRRPQKIRSIISVESSFDSDGLRIFVGYDQRQIVKVTCTIINTGQYQLDGISFSVVFNPSLFTVFNVAHFENTEGLAIMGFGERIQPGQSVQRTVLLEVNPNKMDFRNRYVYVNASVMAGTTTELEGMTFLNTRLNLKLNANIDLHAVIIEPVSFYSGNVFGGLGEWSNSGENSIGNSRMRLKVDIVNHQNRSFIAKSKLVIHWPLETSHWADFQHGPYMFYMLEKPRILSDQVKINCDEGTLTRITNIYNKRIFKEKNRMKGNFVGSSKVTPPMPTEYPDLNDYYPSDLRTAPRELSCFNGRLRCMPLVCQLDSIPVQKTRSGLSEYAKPLTIEINFRVWEDTFRQHFTLHDQINVTVNVQWMPDSALPLDNNGTMVELLAAEILAETSATLAMHNNLAMSTGQKKAYTYKQKLIAISLGTVLGLSVLGVITLLCIRLGFFDRKENLEDKQQGL